uniref:Uncharacterized protein n=1 Tax=Timema genevievae TaxID=629358 RepID=A0A7R9JUU1_TIMGE|nr:unnamed protein product [Timema genevievae]
MAAPFARRNHLKLFRKHPTVQPAGIRTLYTGIPDQMRFFILVHVSKHVDGLTGAPAPPHCSNSPKMAPKASLGVISLTGVLTVMLFVRCGHSAHSTFVKMAHDPFCWSIRSMVSFKEFPERSDTYGTVTHCDGVCTGQHAPGSLCYFVLAVLIDKGSDSRLVAIRPVVREIGDTSTTPPPNKSHI